MGEEGDGRPQDTHEYSMKDTELSQLLKEIEAQREVPWPRCPSEWRNLECSQAKPRGRSGHS